MKSGWNFDRLSVTSSRVDMPAPVASDYIDAPNDLVRGLRAWALLVQFGVGHPWRAEPLEAGISSEDAYEDANGCALVILDGFDRLANDSRVIGHLVAFLCDMEIEGAPGQWTVAAAAAKWPLEDRERWTATPCPECDCKTVRIKPPRGVKSPARFRCTTCDWERSDRDDSGLWAEIFADEVHARDIPLGDKDRTTAHDPRWMTLADAAKLAGVTGSRVHGWADQGSVRRSAEGRYWREDVQARAGALGVDRLLAAMDTEGAAVDAAA
ncbi:hypothetical protein [Microbacterium allomyrinae]|uniref:Uncharacterized protein n=1 Tax=Microbacterium allomyrinae TaxID=2830666 RepID=A0A9X1LSB3_9MICO|nr:hypothetical protein [Microbacterium allomyrinae]MCC2030635.1 hypothetical protein [Microbacterium allomyrinae]